jgi:hypothetical protein
MEVSSDSKLKIRYNTCIAEGDAMLSMSNITKTAGQDTSSMLSVEKPATSRKEKKTLCN